jgi:transposase InsO family protein
VAAGVQTIEAPRIRQPKVPPTNFLIEFEQISGVHLIVPGGSGPPGQLRRCLADMQSLTRYNDNFRYLLTCISVCSKFAVAFPVKDKRETSTAAAFEKMFSQRSPNFLQSARGSEFLNHEVQEMFRKYSIEHYWSYNEDLKASCLNGSTARLK